MKSNTKNPTLTMLAVSAALACTAWTFTREAESKFVGWIRGSKCDVLIRTGLHGSPIALSKNQAALRRLRKGQWVKASGPGDITVVAYGREIRVTPAKGWFEIRDDPKQGRDAFVDFPGQRVIRGTDDISKEEKIWRAMSLIDLANPKTSNSLKVEMRIVAVDDHDRPRNDAKKIGEKLALKVEDSFHVDVKNEGSVPVYINLMDIDAEGTVICQWPDSPKTQHPIMPKSGWIHLRRGFTLGPPEGPEHFKVIATTKPIDLSMLQTKGAVSNNGEVPPIDDPLIYLMRAASLSAVIQKPGQWSTAHSEILVRSEG